MPNKNKIKKPKLKYFKSEVQALGYNGTSCLRKDEYLVLYHNGILLTRFHYQQNEDKQIIWKIDDLPETMFDESKRIYKQNELDNLIEYILSVKGIQIEYIELKK